MYFAEKTKVFNDDPILGSKTFILECSSILNAEFIVMLANLNVEALNHGFTDLKEEKDVIAKLFGDIIDLCRKYTDDKLSQEIMKLFKDLRDDKKIIVSK